MDFERPEEYGVECPWCHQWVTPKDANEKCPASLLATGLHPVVCVDTREVEKLLAEKEK